MAPLITSLGGKLALGLITGFLFGFSLQKGLVVKYEKIVGALRLQDFTIMSKKRKPLPRWKITWAIAIRGLR